MTDLRSPLPGGQTPPSRVWRRWALLVPACVVAGMLWIHEYDSAEGDYLRNWCADHAVPWTMYATAYLALACGVAGVVLGWALWRGARRRGWAAGSVWQGSLSLVSTGFGVLTVAVELGLVWWVGDSDPSGNGDCDVLSHVHGVLMLLS